MNQSIFNRALAKTIAYSSPKLASVQCINKPTAYSGKPYPLFQLEHRDFELIIYSLYKQEIKEQIIPFDNISLMSGVRDKAQDCILYNNHVKSGIIQCKHSENDKPLNTTQCIEEIIKFVLYSLDDETLIPDIKTFTYYFASSSGFDSKADAYLNAFNTNIKVEKNLEKWANNIIKKFESIKQTFNDIKELILEKLQLLKLILIVPDNIQDLLTKYKLTVKRFFEVRLVVDNTKIEKLEHDIKKIKRYTKPKNIIIETVLKEFSNASIFLKDYKNYFSAKNPIKIERNETSKIIEWLKSPLKEKEDNILIVKGNAGSGKSVILNNVYHGLKDSSFPILALKADETSAVTLLGLEQKIHLSNTLSDSIEVLANHYEKIIIIIDQIDALSQSLSVNRDNLNTFILLIGNLKKYIKIRIVISIRDYDLNYDPLLSTFKINTSFDVGKLSNDVVTKVLKELKVSQVSEKLINLLSIPLHLELFCQVYNNNELRLASLYDLYNELWLIKVQEAIKFDSANLKATLYNLSSKIYKLQGSLSINITFFNIKDVKYLKSEGLLLENNRNEVMFFHQTFYDYVFARQFVESNKNVIEYLNENNQGLFIRSCLKIILAHLRQQNPTEYKKLIKEILLGTRIRFHIKQLVIDYLGFIEDPSLIEKEIVELHIHHSKYENYFYEAINSRKWMEFFFETGWLGDYLDASNENINTISACFLRNRHTSSNIILEFLLTFEDQEYKLLIVDRFLYNLNNWDGNAITLFNKYKQSFVSNPIGYCNCIENVLLFDEAWAFITFEGILLNKAEQLGVHNYDYSIVHAEIELIKKLFKVNYAKTFNLCENVFEKINKQTRREVELKNENLYGDIVLYSFTKSNHQYGDQDEFFQLFIEKVEESARSKNFLFDCLVVKHGNSRYLSFLRVVIYGLQSNPSAYSLESFQLLQYVNTKYRFEGYSKFSYQLRQLIRETYIYFSKNQKIAVNKILENLKDDYKGEVTIHPVTKKKTIRNLNGKLQYLFLSSIPSNEIKKFSDLYKKYQELSRKFGIVMDKEPNVICLTGASLPYEKNKCEKMSHNDWISTFLKYNDSLHIDRFSGAGGITEHGRIFEEQVSLRPDYFFSLLEEIIPNSKISIEYKNYGINGLIKIKYFSDKVLTLISLLIKLPLTDSSILTTIWSIDFLIRQEKINSEIFDFLCNHALNNTDIIKEDFDKPVERGINTIRGAAIDRLIRITDKKYSDKIFKFLNKITKVEKEFVIRSVIVHNSAFLLNLNEIKAFKIFDNLIKLDNRLVPHAMWSADYFVHKFYFKMDLFFELAMKETKAFKSLSFLLSKEYIKGNVESEKRLFLLLRKSVQAAAESLRVAKHPDNLIDSNEHLNGNCVKLFEYSLNKTQDEIVHQYSTGFLHFEPKMFSTLHPILLKYSKSKVFKLSPAYFCKYIAQCCDKKNMYKCFDLISSLDKLVKTDISQGNHYESEPINLVLAIYNTLGNSIKDKELKNKCMDMFDKMLQQSQHREAASRAAVMVEL